MNGWMYRGCQKKCIRHEQRYTWTLWSTLLKQQFAVIRSVWTLMVTTLSTSCNCRSQTWLLFIFCYQYILSITIIIQFFPFLNCVYIFWHPLYINK
jgi:hypothetical protein